LGLSPTTARPPGAGARAAWLLPGALAGLCVEDGVTWAAHGHPSGWPCHPPPASHTGPYGSGLNKDRMASLQPVCPSLPIPPEAGRLGRLRSSADDLLLSVAAAHGHPSGWPCHPVVERLVHGHPSGWPCPQLMRDRALDIVPHKTERHKPRRGKTRISIMDVCPSICVQKRQKTIRKRSKAIRFQSKTSKTSTVSSCLV
jgi:hypothetical protein